MQVAEEAGLDASPRSPFVGINLNLPSKAITVAVAELVRGWKKEQGIKESRRRHDKLDDYVAAWDLRE